MISNTTIGNPGTTLSCAIPTGAAAGRGSGLGRPVEFANVHLARVRRSDDWARPFATTVPQYAAVLAATKPQAYVPRPPQDRSP